MNKIYNKIASILYTVTYQNSFSLICSEEQEYITRTKLNGVLIQKVFTDKDIHHNSLFDREQFKNVMKELETGKYAKLIIYSILVLGSNREQIRKWVGKLEKWNVIIKTINTNIENKSLSEQLYYGIVSEVETGFAKMVEISYRIFTGKIGDIGSLTYRGNVLDLNFVECWLHDNKDNYLQIVTFDTLDKHFEYFSETTLENDITKIVSLLKTKKVEYNLENYHKSMKINVYQSCL